ncbi:MAG: bifunctional methylenetetrahydrofolate dehydrogenase/methenyltetrahydrofolate cyclohydrolase FolD [Gammaproteobacteria bacterium]|jgi:methylenetetrahydrofolate dehydrogenase (NADP+)/methenyltetrahydrofolate cyclohydrolase|nr:bifunctional methylenetetrahydrofolate dehydrogenase/methenyltetrahydrofolate cyclohydrolase FolD [Gammaproteobacteria bacterium]MDH3749420.1 bifunctional methylenetetrahydrofolate dehydrogenase/methenyltetrahydrofolate cyclohydrolase FolD [Gammaproteobacteria bacterium]MDH3804936.1 bifunctional methylenetetrahydrofolate dehydrogenase/methenyltetrahydrofolate cyclohydrolase FolD [Gammaproteobacteria bacterium]
MTTAKRIDGKAKAAEMSEKIAADTAALREQHGVTPGLAVVIIGEDPASQVYVRNKKKRAEGCGFYSVQHSVAEDISQEDVLQLINDLNNDASIHGILVQLPLPEHLDEQAITQSISPGKDVDGFHFVNIGKLTSGNTADAFVPCTPAGCMLMIEDQLGRDLSGLSAVVMGRSNIVGKPMASLLMQANATVTITHSRTKDLASVVRQADIVVAAIGRANMVKGDWVKPGAVVIDVGINRIETTVDGETKSRLTGDVDFESVCEVAKAVTPVPGGVGPMTIVMLMANTLRAARLSVGLNA